MMNFVLKMMNSVLKMMNFVLKMIDFAQSLEDLTKQLKVSLQRQISLKSRSGQAAATQAMADIDEQETDDARRSLFTQRSEDDERSSVLSRGSMRRLKVKLKVLSVMMGAENLPHQDADEIYVRVSSQGKSIAEFVDELEQHKQSGQKKAAAAAVNMSPHSARVVGDDAAKDAAVKQMVLFSPGMSNWLEFRDVGCDLEKLFLPAEDSSQLRTGVIGAFIDLFEATIVFVFSMSYVGLLTIWSATSFSCVTSPILAMLAGFSTLRHDEQGGRHLALLQILATLQWLHGMVGVEFQGLSEYTKPWSTVALHGPTAGPLAQQLLALSSALLMFFRYKDAKAHDMGKFLRQMERLRKVGHQIACIILITCGVFEATLATLFYLCAGLVLLVTQDKSLTVWTGIFVTSCVIVVFKTAIYPLPEQAFSLWTGEDDGSAENWNSWIQILGLRACPQIQVTLEAVGYVSDGSSDAEDFQETTDCKTSTMLSPYLVLCAAGTQLWWRRMEIYYSMDPGGSTTEEEDVDLRSQILSMMREPPTLEHDAALKLSASRSKLETAAQDLSKTKGEKPRSLLNCLWQRCVFFVLLYMSFIAIRLAATPRFIDAAVMSALLLHLPFHLTLGGHGLLEKSVAAKKVGYCGKYEKKQVLQLIWLLPSLVIISTVLLQYAATRDQLSCFLLYNLRDAESVESCPLIYSSHGSCNIQQLQSCVAENAGCLRRRNTTCMLTVKEAGLDNALDSDYYDTALWLFWCDFNEESWFPIQES